MVLNLLLWTKSLSPLPENRFAVTLTVNHVEGIELPDSDSSTAMQVDVKWKGPRGVLGTRFRKSFKVDRTVSCPLLGGAVSWLDSFSHECVLLPVSKNGSPNSQSWDVNFVLRKVDLNGTNSSCVIGTASVDLSQFDLSSGKHEFNEILDLKCLDVVPVSTPKLDVTFLIKQMDSTTDSVPAKKQSLRSVSSSESFPELELSDIECHSDSGCSPELCSDISNPQQPPSKKAASPANGSKEIPEKSMISMLSFKSLSWSKSSKPQKVAEEPSSPKTWDTSSTHSLGYETEDDNASIDEFMHYRSITAVNLSANGTLSNVPQLTSSVLDINRQTDIVPASPSPPRPRSLNVKPLLSLCPGSVTPSEDDSYDDLSSYENSNFNAPSTSSFHDSSESHSSELPEASSSSAFLPWRKRKHGAKSPKASLLMQPLLNKVYGDNGGDEIDFDRRESLLIESLQCPFCENDFSTTAQGFCVGSWERRHVKCRDCTFTLHTDVFFASFDQRDELVGGEGACAVLVAMIAEWMHLNTNATPTKTEFDDIIREGSAEWRRLCELENNKENYPDKHLPLEAVFEGSSRKIHLVSEKSFVGFFKPDAMKIAGAENGKDDSTPSTTFSIDQYLEGLMAFDCMWEEVEKSGEGIYIVSWNDHFFVLVVRSDSCYLIDTLGERLMEGCSDAFILRFDSSSSLQKCVTNESGTEFPGPSESCVPESDSCSVLDSHAPISQEPCTSDMDQTAAREGDSSVVRESSQSISPMKMCGLFVKEFLASVPLQDMDRLLKSGMDVETWLKKLQVEVHATEAVHS